MMDDAEFAENIKARLEAEPIEDVVAKNIKARLAAELISELIDEEAKVHGRRFWVEMAKIVNAHVPDPYKPRKQPSVRPMTLQEARNFGSSIVPFGKHNNVPVDSVPMDWLEWLADQTFVDDLRRYLESERVKSEG